MALPQELIESFLDVDYIASTILQCNLGCSIPKENLVPNVPIFRQNYDIHQQCLWSLLPELLRFVRIVMSDGFEFVIRRSVWQWISWNKKRKCHVKFTSWTRNSIRIRFEFDSDSNWMRFELNSNSIRTIFYLSLFIEWSGWFFLFPPCWWGGAIPWGGSRTSTLYGSGISQPSGERKNTLKN